MDFDHSRDAAVSEEMSRKRNHEGKDGGGKESKRRFERNSKPALKMLLPGGAVGRLMGKGGKNIGEVEARYNAHIEVSGAKDYYPGTQDRSVVLFAEVESIQQLVDHIIDEVNDDPNDTRGVGGVTVMAVANAAMGLVMGRGGSIVKEIQEESGANVNIQKQKESMLPEERLVTLTGTKEQKKKAAQMIIEKLSIDPMRMSESRTQYDPYAPGSHRGGGGGDFRGSRGDGRRGGGGDRDHRGGGGGGRDDSRRGGFNLTPNLRSEQLYAQPVVSYEELASKLYGGVGALGGLGGLGSLAAAAAAAVGGGGGGGDSSEGYEAKSRLKAKTSWTITMEVPNELVGTIVGKGGQTINEITRTSHAQISFSGKEEFAPGTQDRLLTIQGNKKQVQKAHMLIDQRVLEADRNAPQNHHHAY